MTQGRPMLYACLLCLAVFGLLTFAAPGEASAQQAAGANPVVVLETNKGPITVELFQEQAPITVANFLQYVDAGHYDGTVFHRVIPGFMIQGGGFSEQLREKPTRSPIRNESSNGLENKRGTLAMARTSVPDSATAQFFINLVDNSFLDRARAQDRVGYAVFGRVIAGMEVVDAIAKEPTGSRGGLDDVPRQSIVILKASRRNAGAQP